MTDLILALCHHLLVFGIAAVLAAEAGFLRAGLTQKQLNLLGRLDALYGLFAVLILVVGFGRVFYGVRGPEFFLGNPWFWGKLVVFAMVGIVSAPPTIRYLAWARRARGDRDFTITQADVLWVRRFLFTEIALFALIPLLAAAMVRVPFL